jgi:MFS family permease
MWANFLNMQGSSIAGTYFRGLPETDPQPQQPRIYTRGFYQLCTSTVLFMASFGMIMPELPAHLEAMGGAEHIGLIIGVFTLAAFISRFFSGRIADLAGRKKVMIIGTVVTAAAGFGYLVAVGVTSFLVLRFLHGFSTGFRPTGTTAMLADIIPKSRRGEALGYLGIAGNTGMAAGPVLGSYLAVEFGMDAMFIMSSVLGVLSLWITFKLPESLPNPRKVSLGDLNIFKGDIIDIKAWPAAIFLLPVAFAFGVFLTITPDFVEHLGYVYKGSFNTIMISSAIAMRVFAGRASDRYGREPLLFFGAVLLCAGMWLLSVAETKAMASVGGVVYGLSIGINMPTIFAWTADLASRGKVAMALGTMLMALEIGIGWGAIQSGLVYAGDVANISRLYAYCSWFAAISSGGLAFAWIKMNRRQGKKVDGLGGE